VDFDVSVIVPLFGDDDRYRVWAHERALPSIAAQTHPAVEVVLAWGENVMRARNLGARTAYGEWLCFVDADDEIGPDYLTAMSAGSADLRGPATVFVQPDGSETAPALVRSRPLEDSNYLVIGTLVRRSMFHAVGGFRDFPVHEDYDLWLRCERRAQATIEQLPNAVYRVYQRPDSRNVSKSRQYRLRIDARIKATA